MPFLVLGLAALAVVAVALWAARRSTSSRSDRSVQEFLVAGRDLPLVVGALTMTATWVGGGYINGTAEAIYDPALGLWWAQAPVCYALSLVVGGLFFAGPMRRRGHTTMLDPFQERYGNGTTSVFLLTAIAAEVFWSAAILAALGATLAAITGMSLGAAILVSAAIVIAYTALGGLWSVAYTDVLQLGLILFGLVLTVPFILGQVGGLAEVIDGYLARQQLAEPIRGASRWRWLDTALMLTLGGVPWQVYFQRVLACRDTRTARNLSLAAAVGCLVLAVPPALIGAAAAVADWGALGAAPPTSAAEVLPHVMASLTPDLVGAIGLAAVTAAVMSSTDSSMLSAASMLSWNFARPLLPEHAEAHLRMVLRLCVVLVGALAAVLALSVQSVYALWFLCSDLVYVVLFPQLVLVLFASKRSRTAALSGVATGLFLRLGAGEAALGVAPFLAYPLADEMPYRTLAMLGNLTVTWIVAVLRGRSCN